MRVTAEAQTSFGIADLTYFGADVLKADAADRAVIGAALEGIRAVTLFTVCARGLHGRSSSPGQSMLSAMSMAHGSIDGLSSSPHPVTIVTRQAPQTTLALIANHGESPVHDFHLCLEVGNVGVEQNDIGRRLVVVS